MTLLSALDQIPDPGPDVSPGQRLAIQQQLDAAAESAPRGVNPETVLLYGPPGRLIADACDGVVDLLVTGSRGYGPVHRALLGSVSEELIALARIQSWSFRASPRPPCPPRPLDPRRLFRRARARACPDDGGAAIAADGWDIHLDYKRAAVRPRRRRRSPAPRTSSPVSASSGHSWRPEADRRGPADALPVVRGVFGDRLQLAMTGAAPIGKEILEFFDSCGILVLEGYG